MKVINTFVLLILVIGVQAQNIKSPVSWKFDISNNNDGTYLVTAKADIDKSWYVYSSKIGDDGPIPTSIEYLTPQINKGEINELSERIENYDSLFEMTLIKFKKEAIFTQIIKPESSDKKLKGILTFMACDESRCLPPEDVNFSLPLNP